LRLFGLDKEAKDFYDKAIMASQTYNINAVAKAYWWRALNEDVWKSLS
jgi:hypothetical protein